MTEDTIMLKFCTMLLAVAAGFLSHAEAAECLDAITFGNAASEQTHSLQAIRSEIIQGGLGEPARQLLPLTPVSFDGGSVTFKLKVDPHQQNYLTVKLWGSDKGEGKGRLLLYLDGQQVGYRHEGDYDVLNQTDEEALFQGRFVYQTLPLPPMRTQGRTDVELKIAGLGRMWPYGPNFAQKQKDLAEPTRGVYCAYTHTNTYFTPEASEKQGIPPASKTRPKTAGEELLAQMKATVNSRLDQLLKPNAKPSGAQSQMLILAEAYNTAWSTASHSDQAIAAIVRLGDAFVRTATIDPADWVGAGPFGEAIARIGHNPQLEKALDAEIEMPAQLPVAGRPNRNQTTPSPAPSTETTRMTRRSAWSKILSASVHRHRTKGRRAYTNQSMIVDYNIYAANRGLMVIDPAQALLEKDALRYLYEAIGLLPWLGNDTPEGGSEKPYGTNYFQITRKGLSRELGYVGTYGETILKFCRDMADLSGDDRIRQQLIRLETARMNFRYPSLDPDGYRVMKLASEIDSRTAHFPVPNGAYTVADVREAWWMELPALAKDPVSVGAAQQCLEDNQYFFRLAQRANDNDTLGMMRNLGDYATVQALPKSAFRMPMSEGQPDFVFCDEENAVLALKHGQERLFVNFYFRQEFGVSGATRVLDITPKLLRIATLKSQFEVIPAGQDWTRPDVIDFERSGGFPPPGQQIHQAWMGEKLPISKRPADATQPKYGTWGPFVGKAAFYWLRYGDYLFAVNTTETNTYSLPAQPGLGKVPDLVSGKVVELGGAVPVEPRTTRILYLAK
jgi:hypothetical protein